MITAEHIKAARALLGWDQQTLALKADIGIATLRRIESQHGRVRANSDTIWKIQMALEAAGIALLFEDGDSGIGVRLIRRL